MSTSRAAVFRMVLAAAALFSGAALLTHIVAGVSLSLALASTTAILGASLAWVWASSDLRTRRMLIRYLSVGAVSGVMATGAYDAAKYVLSQLDPSPFDPFETLRTFGTLLVGGAAPAPVLLAAGTAFHLLNGVAFGVAFCFAFGGRGLVAGILWGLVLETFQLAIFPGWLDIRFFEEFAQISLGAHLVYGATLAKLCQIGLGKAG